MMPHVGHFYVGRRPRTRCAFGERTCVEIQGFRDGARLIGVRCAVPAYPFVYDLRGDAGGRSKLRSGDPRSSQRLAKNVAEVVLERDSLLLSHASHLRRSAQPEPLAGRSKLLAMERVLIIGSGPAGLTAAVYAARANLKPLILAGGLYGGQLMLTTDVENYPGFVEGIMGPDLMMRFREQAERFGARVENVDATSVDFTKSPFIVRTTDDEYHAKTVIIATGASARWLNIPGEEKLRGRGVSTCATCDGAFFRDKHIVVVGGGDSAMEEALFLTRFGRKVTLIHRRDHLRASKIMAERARAHEKIDFIWNTVVDEVLGDTHVTGLRLRNIHDDSVFDFDCDALFIAIGHDPNTKIFEGQIDLDEAGYIDTPDGVTTNVEGVFVAGDVSDLRYKQAITAAGAGCKAAMDAERYLEALEFSLEPAEPAAHH